MSCAVQVQRTFPSVSHLRPSTSTPARWLRAYCWRTVSYLGGGPSCRVPSMSTTWQEHGTFERRTLQRRTFERRTLEGRTLKGRTLKGRALEGCTQQDTTVSAVCLPHSCLGV